MKKINKKEFKKAKINLVITPGEMLNYIFCKHISKLMVKRLLKLVDS
ncbi:MAG: hypothetical protein HOO06_10720 [Bdellovibrionaceae bacterium]|jgi:hypothetical protein|nr:hypothetical protein [Pseudobdellovibrionaceae bacterium]